MQPGARRFVARRGVPKSLSTYRSGRNSRQTGPPVTALECRRARRPGGAGGAGDAADRQAQLRHAPREAAAERPARDWDNPEDVVNLHLGD
jgi:hypothetical protein